MRYHSLDTFKETPPRSGIVTGLCKLEIYFIRFWWLLCMYDSCFEVVWNFQLHVNLDLSFSTVNVIIVVIKLVKLKPQIVRVEFYFLFECPCISFWPTCKFWPGRCDLLVSFFTVRTRIVRIRIARIKLLKLKPQICREGGGGGGSIWPTISLHYGTLSIVLDAGIIYIIITHASN